MVGESPKRCFCAIFTKTTLRFYKLCSNLELADSGRDGTIINVTPPNTFVVFCYTHKKKYLLKRRPEMVAFFFTFFSDLGKI